MKPVFELFALDSKVALVTGASSGIGRTMALALAEAGAAVVLVGRDSRRLGETASEAQRLGPRTAILACDLAQRSEQDRVVDEAAKFFGTPDILVNAAGVNPRPPLAAIDRAMWEDTMAVNLEAAFFLSKHLGFSMCAKRWGRIVNIASMQTVKAFGNSGVYGVSKAAVAGLTRTLAEEFSPHGVNCNAIVPGFFPTPLAAPVFADPTRAAAMAARTMIGRNGRLEDLRGVTLFLTSAASDYVTGQTVFVDGGFSVH